MGHPVDVFRLLFDGDSNEPKILTIGPLKVPLGRMPNSMPNWVFLRNVHTPFREENETNWRYVSFSKQNDSYDFPMSFRLEENDVVSSVSMTIL